MQPCPIHTNQVMLSSINPLPIPPISKNVVLLIYSFMRLHQVIRSDPIRARQTSGERIKFRNLNDNHFNALFCLTNKEDKRLHFLEGLHGKELMRHRPCSHTVKAEIIKFATRARQDAELKQVSWKHFTPAFWFFCDAKLRELEEKRTGRWRGRI